MNNKVRNIEKPKPLKDLGKLIKNLNFEECLKYSRTARITDDKGRYLHWNEFKRKDQYKDNPELWWLFTKFSRISISKRLNLGNLEFYFCQPDTLNALLHFIDKNSVGNIGTSDLVSLSRGELTKYLVSSMIIEEAISSAQLEGASTTRKVAKEMLYQERKPKTKDERMILNNYLLMKEVVKLKDKPLSVEMILELHRLATEGAIENEAVAGEFRTSDNICVRDWYNNIVHQPPKFQDLPQLMDEFCQFANKDHSYSDDFFIHPIVKAIILHFLIGYIHPFGDGNGRTARALFYWFMLKNGYWLFEYISISKLLKKASTDYGKAYIYTETDDLDMTYFIYFQTKIIRQSLEDFNKYLRNKQKMFEEFTSMIASYASKFKLNKRQIHILAKALKVQGRIFTPKEISNIFDIAENTARSDLNHLLALNLLVSIKNGRSTEYIAPSDLRERLQK